MEITLRVDIMPRHIRTAGVILAGVIIVVLCGSNSLPLLRSQNALHVVGPFVAPVTEFAQFIAIGPENSVPQRYRACGIAAYVAFFAVSNAACSRYFATPYVTAVLQDLYAALRGEAPSPLVNQLGVQQIEELVCFVPTVFMSACLGVFTLALGLDLVGPWTIIRTFHFISGFGFLISPLLKYPDVRTWAEAAWRGENPHHTIMGLTWAVTATLVTTVRNRRSLARRMIAHHQLAQQLEIDGPVGNPWGQKAHADAADEEGAESAPKLSPHLIKGALAFSLTLALYGPLLKAFDLPAGSPVFALSSVI